MYTVGELRYRYAWQNPFASGSFSILTRIFQREAGLTSGTHVPAGSNGILCCRTFQLVYGGSLGVRFELRDRGVFTPLAGSILDADGRI